MARILWVPYIIYKVAKETGAYVLEGFAWILLKLRAFVSLLGCGASFSWEWDRSKNSYYKKFKPGPERLTRKDQQEEKKAKKTGPPAEANDPVL